MSCPMSQCQRSDTRGRRGVWDRTDERAAPFLRIFPEAVRGDQQTGADGADGGDRQGGRSWHRQPRDRHRVLQYLADAGVDEALLFMQLYTTPHDKIMRSIELLAKEVMPTLK